MTERLALDKLMDPTWAAVMAPVESEIRAMGDFLRNEIAQKRPYLPAGTDTFRAFTYPLDQVKVLIVGQDPYPTPGHAMGLSFSVQPGVRPLPRSLQNIYKELNADLGLPLPQSGDLRPWSRQGVMLLNRVLSVRPGAPASHRGKGWEHITECAIDSLVARDAPLVAILWGRDAQSLTPRLADTPIIASTHPSPMSADRGFFGSKPFSRANRLLEDFGAEPINWDLSSQETQ